MSNPKRSEWDPAIRIALHAWRRCRVLVKKDWRADSPIRAWLTTWIYPKGEVVALHMTWIFTAVLAGFAFQAWRDAGDASAKQQQQLEILRREQRPWLSVERESIDPSLTGEGGSLSSDGTSTHSFGIRVQLVLRNTGKSPGHFVRVLAGTSYVKEGFAVLPRECAQLKAQTVIEKAGVSVFPNQIKLIPLDLYIVGDAANEVLIDEGKLRKQDFDANGKMKNEFYAPEGLYSPNKSLYITGCIDYILTNDEDDPDRLKHHQTPFVYKVGTSSLGWFVPHLSEAGAFTLTSIFDTRAFDAD